MMFLLPPTTSFVVGGYILLSQKMQNTKIYVSRNLLKACIKPIQYLNIIGVLSYGLYLWHAPIASYIFQNYGVPTGIFQTIERMGIVFGTSLILAFVSYVLIEEPALRMKAFLGSRRT